MLTKMKHWFWVTATANPYTTDGVTKMAVTKNGPLLYLYIDILFFTLFNYVLYQAMEPVGKIPGFDAFQLGLLDVKWIIWQ